MIMVINQKESAALTLHMSIMRKSYRKLIKTRYKAHRERLYLSYDYLLGIAKDALINKNEVNEVYLNITDLEVLYEFLKSYTSKLEQLDNKNTDLLEQLQILKDIHTRCEELKAA